METLLVIVTHEIKIQDVYMTPHALGGHLDECSYQVTLALRHALALLSKVERSTRLPYTHLQIA